MIPKIIQPDSFDFGMPVVALLGTYSKGFHKEALEKRAAQFDGTFDDIEKKPNHTYLHLITTGAGTVYGSNNNGDFFNKEAYTMRPFLHPEKSLQMGGGLQEYHDKTFMEFGGVYKGHRNKHKGGIPSGYIVKAAYNKEMGRGELIVGVDNDKWSKELEKVANEKPIYFSMACFTKDALVLRDSGQLSPINTIETGDRVLTHTGGSAIVDSVKETSYEDVAYCNIKLSGAMCLTCTAEHPFLLVRSEDVQNPKSRRVDYTIDPLECAEWIKACDVRAKDYALTPIDRVVEQPSYVTPAFARLAGYYLAEGYIIYNDGKPQGLRLCLNASDVILDHLDEIVESLNLKRYFRLNHTPDKHFTAATIYDAGIASQMLMLFGHDAHDKYIHPEVQRWDKESQLQLIGAYIDGDGGFYTSSHECVVEVRGSAYLTSCNYPLMAQVQRMVARWGFTPAVTKTEHKCRTIRDRELPATTSYTINCGIQLSNALVAYSDKIQHTEVIGKYGHAHRLIIGDYLLVRVKEVEQDRGPLVVYNMEVDHEDHSYLVNGVAVHNCDVASDCCSACSNRATTLGDYCDHLKNDMMDLTKEGHQVYAINDKPLFHDISGVFKPADKIAFALRKVASGGVMSSAELASLHGMAPRLDIMRKYAGVKPSKRVSLLSKLAVIEKEILTASSGEPIEDLMLPFKGGCPGIEQFDDSTVNALKGEDPGALFGSMKNKMVVMPFETFLKIVAGDGADQIGPTADKAKELLPGVFGRLLESPDMESSLSDGSYEPSGLCGGRELEEKISRLVGSHSLAAEPVKSRVIKITISGSPKGSEAEMPKCASKINDAAADFLAKEYARYVISFADGMPEDKLGLTVAQTIANSI